EVCPSSNVALGFAPSPAEHPFRRLREQGLLVTINTDIPAMTGASLTSEYALVKDAFGYDDKVLADLAKAGVTASFAPQGIRTRLTAEIDTWLTR
ncbi:adenosine deaminase, partial [Actinomadura adrarensis]